MGVVELDSGACCQGFKPTMSAHVSAQHIPQRGRGEEIFLAQPQFAAGWGLVTWVEHAGNGLSTDAAEMGRKMIPAIEGFELEGSVAKFATGIGL